MEIAILLRRYQWIVIALLFIAFIIFNHVITSFNIYLKRSDWESYKETNLLRQSELIQETFSKIEKDSFSLLEEIIKTPKFTEKLKDMFVRPADHRENQAYLFKSLFSVSSLYSGMRRAIAIYAADKSCVARSGEFFQIPGYWLEESLSGLRFSSITESERRVYLALCTFLPIPHPSEKRIIGVAVAFTPLDTRYPISSRYIKSQSLTRELISKTGLQEIKIDYSSQDKPSVPSDSLVTPLKTLNRERLGWLIITSIPLEVKERDIILRSRSIDRLVAGLLTLFLFFFFLRAVIRFKASLVINIILYTMLFSGLRLGLLLIQLPNDLFPPSFISPTVFCSPLLGDFSRNLGDTLITSLIFVSYVWNISQILIPVIRQKGISAHGIWKWIFLFIIFASIILFIWLIPLCRRVISSMIQHSHFILFDNLHFAPPLENFILYNMLLTFGFAIINILGIWYIIVSAFLKGAGVRIGFRVLFIAGFVLGAPYLLHTDISVWISILSLSILFIGVAVRVKEIIPSPLRLILLITIAGFFLYPLINIEVRDKDRIIIEDLARKDRESSLREALEQSLAVFEMDSKLAENIKEEKSNTAFLLWANSPFMGKLDNLDLLLYNQQGEEISRFSFNMPPVEWYPDFPKTILDENDNDYKLKLKRGRGEGYNTEFLIGISAIKDQDNKIVGKILLITQVHVQPWALPVPKVFSNRPINELEPFEGYFVRHTLINISNPNIQRAFRPEEWIVDQVYQKRKKIWIKEKIDSKEYENFYFPHIVGKRVQGMRLLGYEVRSWQERIFFLLQFILSGLFLVIVGILCQKLIKAVQSGLWHRPLSPSFEQKLLACFIFTSALPMIILAYFSKERAVQAINANYAEELREFLNIAERTFREEQGIPLAPDDLECQIPNDIRCRAWGQRYGRIINYYLQDQLVSTSHRELFNTGLLSTVLSGEVYYNLMLSKRDFYITNESIGDYPFIVGYKALVSGQDPCQIVGAISIPMLYRQEEIDRSLIRAASWIFTLYVILFIVVVGLGILMAHKITRPLAKLLEGTQRVSAGELDFSIPVHSRDEIGMLVQSFNRMTSDLKISQEKLVHVEKDAAWREMARRIAHEIKNPLTPMKLSAQHILRAYQDKSEKFDQIINKGILAIIDSIETLARTASAFSEFAKFDRPHLQLLPITPILEDSITLFSSYKEKNYKFAVDIQQDLPKIQIDKDQVKRGFINLFKNAIEAMEGGGTITVKAYKSEEKIIVSVNDTGTGIPEDLKEKIFDPNFSTKSYGSGLGLAITKRILENIGASIFVESRQGEGTTFTITFLTKEERNQEKNAKLS